MNNRFISLFFVCWFLASCGPQNTQNIYQKEGRYPQSIKTTEALFIRERNEAPGIMASAFLIDKERGLFASAKHFVGSESDGQCKIFFNGRVYDGFLVGLPAITDVVVIKITGGYNQKNFPEPYGFAGNIQAGKTVFVRGIHIHPKNSQENKIVIPILRQYYGIIGAEVELVYDDLAGLMVKTDEIIRKDETNSSSELLADVSSRFFKIRTAADHGFSFGGLSGGPVVNERNELVGITSSEAEAYYEQTDKGFVYHPWETLNLVPIAELQKLMSQLADIR